MAFLSKELKQGSEVPQDSCRRDTTVSTCNQTARLNCQGHEPLNGHRVNLKPTRWQPLGVAALAVRASRCSRRQHESAGLRWIREGGAPTAKTVMLRISTCPKRWYLTTLDAREMLPAGLTSHRQPRHPHFLPLPPASRGNGQLGTFRLQDRQFPQAQCAEMRPDQARPTGR